MSKLFAIGILYVRYIYESFQIGSLTELVDISIEFLVSSIEIDIRVVFQRI